MKSWKGLSAIQKMSDSMNYVDYVTTTLGNLVKVEAAIESTELPGLGIHESTFKIVEGRQKCIR